MKITAYDPQQHLALNGSVGTTAYAITRQTVALGSNTPKIEAGSGAPGSGPQASAWDHVHPQFSTGSNTGFRKSSAGGEEVVQSHGSMGATETIDVANGNYHYGTLNANCTFTFATPTAGVEADFTLELTQDGTGGWDCTFPASVASGTALATSLDQTAGTTSLVVFITRNGGTTWYGFLAGGGSGASVSYGSNSTRVSALASVGAGSEVARATHIHDGIGTVSASSSNTMDRGTLNLRAGSNISFGLTDSDGSGGLDTLTIHGTGSSGGGGGSTITIQYPALKPTTPTYDFAGAALDGAFSAHSSGGTFVTGNCMTQGASPWPGSTLEMQFNAQHGRLTLAHADTDLDTTWGGVQAQIGEAGNVVAWGVMALNSSGNGIGVLTESTNMHFGKVVAYQFTTVLASWTNGTGPSTLSHITTGASWVRIRRVSGVWTGFASISGRAWDKTFATDSTSYTIDRLAYGLFFNTGTLYTGRILSDYIQVDV